VLFNGYYKNSRTLEEMIFNMKKGSRDEREYYGHKEE
jgi:hypothetical protein